MSRSTPRLNGQLSKLLKHVHGILPRKILGKTHMSSDSSEVKKDCLDHFADLGGKSINAVSIIAKMEIRYRIQTHSHNLAENPTIAQLAANLDKHPLPVRGVKGKRAKFFRG